MLDQEPTAGDEMRGSGSDDAGELVEGRRAADQGFRGLRPQEVERRIPGGDIRWIREDEIEALVSDRGEPGTYPPFDLGQPEGGGVVAGDSGRRFENVDADDARAAALEG